MINFPYSNIRINNILIYKIITSIKIVKILIIKIITSSMKNKIAIVTGGAKRLGREIVKHLVKNNWQVIIHYNSSKEEAHVSKVNSGRIRLPDASEPEPSPVQPI